MTAYIIRRLFYTIPVVLGVSVIVFLLFNVVGGDPTAVLVGKNPKPRDVRSSRKKYGLDKPLLVNVHSLRDLTGGVDQRLYAATALAGNDREEALQGIFDYGNASIPFLMRILLDDFAAQRRIAASLLAERIGPRKAFDPGADEETREKALEPWRAWWEANRDRYPLRMHDPFVWAQLDRASGDDPEEAGEARRALQTLGDLAVPALIDAVLGGDAERKGVVSVVLLEMTGFPVYVDPDAKEADRIAAVQRWRTWWNKEGERYRPSSLGRLWSLTDSQFFHFLFGAATFDFGRSFKYKQKISQMIRDGIVPSLTLSVPAFFLGVLVAVYISVLCAFYRNTWIDRTIVILSVLGMSLSMLVYIIACQYFLAYRLDWFPIWGYRGGLASVSYLLLPILIWILVALGSDVRFFRTVILDEINQDYVRTAQAKGLSQNVVLFKHVLKNAMIPIITRLVIAIPFLYAGSLLLERFFGIPGLGNMMVEAVNNSDLYVVRAMTFIGAILYVFGNLLTDICYALVDPRIRLG